MVKDRYGNGLRFILLSEQLFTAQSILSFLIKDMVIAMLDIPTNRHNSQVRIKSDLLKNVRPNIVVY